MRQSQAFHQTVVSPPGTRSWPNQSFGWHGLFPATSHTLDGLAIKLAATPRPLERPGPNGT
eukprot:11210131-Lingulodinium_polyedra.AAC.1